MYNKIPVHAYGVTKRTIINVRQRKVYDSVI